MEYKYVNIKTTGKGIFCNKTVEHRKIIDEHAANGYRYVGWFPTKSSNLVEGVIEEVDLIFEKVQ